MSNATFKNISTESFTGYWNGKPKTFKAGESVLMPAYLAEHFAKHLTNRELIKQGKETATSPKFPEQQPDFMEIFSRAFVAEAVKEGANEVDEIIDSARGNTEPSMNIEVKKGTPPKTAADHATGPSQVIVPPGDDDDDFDHSPAEGSTVAKK